MALLISAVAAVVSFGFFPIVWFIDFTSGSGDQSEYIVRGLLRFFIIISLVMGFLHMGRCFVWSDHFKETSPLNIAIICCWLALLTHIIYRMAKLLEI